MTIKFSSQKQTEIIEYSDAPILQVLKANYSTEEKNWVHTLIPSSLIVKISALNNKNEIILSNHELLHLQITPYHVQPVFEINRFFKPTTKPSRSQGRIQKWTVEIAIQNLKFKKGESITIELIDRNYILRRIDDWEKRVHDLITQLSLWISTNNNLEIKPGRKSLMHEGLMKDFEIPVRELETADILKRGKLTMAIKPFGLWIMGANGRIDLMRAIGNLILIDEAEDFQKPKWKVFLGHNRQVGLELNKKVFTEIISL
jgi:hypothetical protein